MIHGDILGERARISPSVTALVEVSSGVRFSYLELDRRAAACAASWHQEIGLGAGDRIAILSGNRVEFIDCFFAAAKSGVTLVPLNSRLAVPELATILGDSGASALIFDKAHSETAAALAQGAAGLTLIALDEPAADARFQYGKLLEDHRQTVFERVVVAPEHPHCLLYTSGTTGQPKGVIVPHRMVAWNGFTTAVAWQLSAADVSPVFTPLYHAGGLGAFLIPILTVGGRIILHAGFDAGEIWRTIRDEGCTVVLGVPTIWALLAEAPELAATDLSGVRWFISGGAPLPRHIIETYRERGVVLRQGYGMTEVGVNCFTMTDEEAWAKAGSIGRPMPYLETRVADADNHDLPPGEIGELCFRGPAVCLGYWNQPEATAASRDDHGWFHTGDMVSVDDDGFFYIAGRAKDMFISGGVNVYPAEIENQLLQHPDLADAAVVGVPDPTWGELGVAFVVAVAGREVTGDQLADFLGGRLARFKIPKQWMVLDEMPRTAYGKVVKPQLQELWQEQVSGRR
jgi:fatty-acyl-CoA synthase